MEVTGKITRVFEVITGNGRKGTWSKQEFILEQPGQYPRPLCLVLWGEDLITKYDLTVGLTVTAHINLESREYNGRWYTEAKAWKVTWDTQQKREWQPGGDGKRGAPAFDDSQEDTSLRSHYEGQGNLDKGPDTGDDLPF